MKNEHQINREEIGEQVISHQLAADIGPCGSKKLILLVDLLCGLIEYAVTVDGLSIGKTIHLGQAIEMYNTAYAKVAAEMAKKKEAL